MRINYDDKHIYRINSSMRIEKRFVLWDRITWLTSGPVSFTVSICCYGHSEKPEQSLSSKYFCIIVLYDCVPKQQASASESNDSIYCLVFSLWSASNLCLFCPHFGVSLPEVGQIDKLFPTRRLVGECRFTPHHVESVCWNRVKLHKGEVYWSYSYL